MKHKHAKLIKAWADGAEIEFRAPRPNFVGGWYEWVDCTKEPWWHNDYEYRIKPEPKIDAVFHAFTTKGGSLCWVQSKSKGNLEIIFDGETGELKSAEILK